MPKIYPGYFLRCPINTSFTLAISVSCMKKGKFYTNNPRAIHMLRMSLFVSVNMDDGCDPGEISCPEFFPDLKADKKGNVRIPDFGYFRNQIVWVCSQAVHNSGKELTLKDLPRAVSEHFLIEASNRVDIKDHP
jgi:hypothetical protein